MQIEHIAIWTTDIERMKDFYCRYFAAVAGEKYINPKKHFQSYFLSFEKGPRLELMQMIRQPGANANPYVAMIMLTGHSEKKRVMAARDAGVTEFLAKPISAKALYQRIINVVANPRPFIKTKTYFGPDRRRNTPSNYIGPERRKGGKADVIRQTPLLEKARAPV